MSGATIQFYAASTNGDTSAAIALLTSVVKTDSNGQFSITEPYTCPDPGSLVYLVAALTGEKMNG